MSDIQFVLQGAKNENPKTFAVKGGWKIKKHRRKYYKMVRRHYKTCYLRQQQNVNVCGGSLAPFFFFGTPLRLEKENTPLSTIKYT